MTSDHLNTYQIYDLLESHTKGDDDGRGLINDWPVLGVVVLQKICQQFLLIGAATATFNKCDISLSDTV